MIRLRGLKGFQRRFRCFPWGVLAPVVAVVMLCSHAQAYSGLTIDATFGSGFTSQEEGAINAAIGVLETDISNNITVSIDFQVMSSGLGESDTYIYNLSYYQYYNALKAVATSPAQLEALASLGAAPTSPTSGNPVTGNDTVVTTGPLARALGFSASPPPGQYDTVISLNTSITSPPHGLPGYYSLQSVAAHELDEALGIGGAGSDLGYSSAVGPLDLYRYSAPGVRSYTTDPNATSYFSINGGTTVLSYFNQTAGADYGDWLSNPIPAGFEPQVQDAFGTPGANPALGVNELTALNVVGYSLNSQGAVPEPSTITMLATAMLALSGYSWSRRKQRAGKAAA